jgi:hypothetical protein
LVEYPIAQAQVTTGGNTFSKVKGNLFFVELGAGSKCRASVYSDKGVEILKDETNNITLEINKETGELIVTDDKGITETIISSQNKDYVRLIADNNCNTCKSFPNSLKLIFQFLMVTSELFEMDGHGLLL